MLLVAEPSQLSITLCSINSPTIKDSEIEVQARLGGKPILLFDPIFVNGLAKFARNSVDQSAAGSRQILKELLEQEKLARAREQALLRQE